ncbi:DUF2938 family protein [Halomonas urumqiensis]|uniref:DUF2938 domain-containing protein n=1 Tax=Halomonas urumqiensis TaxID=1684789 RepID=A0A2N7UF81_9GAMM|nr:DUF2938 family protein [Halomonas urumqiensis]PMR79128.1 DUF2938 domain-containing protein [Halomonas urumqiensis]PTB03803.1 DUF2938 domain-containing protein [Halomonas urumqiensis]GHE19964.1 membrane protein [Halomonas urumqiensis]
MLDFLILSVLIGAGATAFLDLWNLLLNRLFRLPLPPWHLVGRWFAGLGRGQLKHRQGIAESPEVPGELAIGWLGHYLVGALFAAIVLVIWGVEWAAAPTFLPALIVGLVTVGAGWFILQPGMGVGVACSGAARPWLARVLNVAGHVVFAIGLYVTAVVIG